MTAFRRFPTGLILLIVIALSTFLIGCRRCLSPGTPDRVHAAGSPSVPSTPASTSPGETIDLAGSELLVSLRSGTDPLAIARTHRLTWKLTLKADPDMHVFAASSGDAVLAAKQALAADSQVRRVYLNAASRNEPFDR